jgi:hypothetical protein
MAFKFYSQDGTLVSEFFSVRKAGDRLVFRAKLMGAIHIDLHLKSEEIINGIKLALNWGVISYILLIPYFMIKHLMKVSKAETKKEGS